MRVTPRGFGGAPRFPNTYIERMEILIVRHGEAGKADPRRHPDDDLRPLTEKGERRFHRAAKGLRALGLRPAKILASPALRTMGTARLLADRLGLRARQVSAADALHHSVSAAAALRSLARDLSGGRGPARFALVGHEPQLGRLVSLLVSGSTGANLPLEKGGAALVDVEALRAGAGTLRWLLTQDQLIELAR